MKDFYIDPKNATHVRVHQQDKDEWVIDAADDEGGYTEVCWDSWYATNASGEREWYRIMSEEAARALAPKFIEENVPHLKGTEPRTVTA